MKKFQILALCLMLGISSQAQKIDKSHTVNIQSLEQLQKYFSYDPNADIIISGHRGGMSAGYPENCIESCERTLELMPSFFEIDPQMTKDSVMVLMHDSDIKRTTTGTGLVSDYTYAELQQFNLKDRQGNVTPYKIPTLKEVLEWGKNITVFNFDNKNNCPASWAYYAKQLAPGGDWSMYHNIMLSVRSLEEAMFYWNYGLRNIMFCSEISDMEKFKAYDKSPIPWDRIMAYIRYTVDASQQEVYDALHAKGVMTMTSITPTADKVKLPVDKRAAYLRELLAEPDIIETDYPSEFLDLPRTRAAIHKMQDDAIKGYRPKAVVNKSKK